MVIHLSLMLNWWKERIFNLTTSKVQTQNAETAKFESGKIDADMKKLLKSAIFLEEPIGGYKKMEIGRQFHTKDLLMQKEYLLDGGKYRVEKWYLKNKTMDKLVLDKLTPHKRCFSYCI